MCSSMARASRYADWFDIDWNPPRPGMEGKLLVPFLGASYAEAWPPAIIAPQAGRRWLCGLGL